MVRFIKNFGKMKHPTAQHDPINGYLLDIPVEDIPLENSGYLMAMFWIVKYAAWSDLLHQNK